MTQSQKVYLVLKRLIDIIGSIFGIIVLFCFIWIWLIPVNFFVTKGHPFFISERIGKEAKPFKFYKFRSMKLSAKPNMSSREEMAKSSVTKFGFFLRKTSLDETLQLFNILFGQMCFIGPRPLIPSCEDSITIEERKKNGSIHIRPGLSGYAQVHGRASIDPKIKGEMDGYYFQHFSLWFDMKIFVYTILLSFKLVKGRG